MKNKSSLRKLFLFSALASLITVNTPAKAADAIVYHSGGINRTVWSSYVLNSQSLMQQDITPLVIPGSRFSSVSAAAYAINWCWQTESGFKTYFGEVSCGRVMISGFENTKNGNVRAIFEFGIFDSNGLASSSSGDSCQKVSHADIDWMKTGRTDTFYGVCTKTFDLVPGTTYTLKSNSDVNRGSDWWTGTLYNNSTKQTITLGSVRVAGALFDKPLNSIITDINYWGEQVPCDAVPVLDTAMSAIQIDANKTTLNMKQPFAAGSCVNAVISDLTTPYKGYLLKIGGIDPTTRKVDFGNTNQNNSGISIGSNNTISNNNVSIGSNNNIVIKPSLPKITGINFSNNTLNLNVDIGSVNRPDKIYLVSPKLGIDSAKSLMGTIDGSFATWSIPLTQALTGISAPFEIVSELGGVKSDPLVSVLAVPNLINTLLQRVAPPIPSNLKYNVIGASLIVSVDVASATSGQPTSAFLFAPQMGISRSTPKSGDIFTYKAVFEIPLKQSMLGKKFAIGIYTTNNYGASTIFSGYVKVPAPSGIPTTVGSLPITVNRMQTVICTKGTLTRTFSAKTCPPGWKA